MRNKTRYQFLLIFCGLMLALVLPIQAQLTRGSISGTVTDQAGSVVPGGQASKLPLSEQIFRVMQRPMSQVFIASAHLIRANIPLELKKTDLRLPKLKN